MKQAKVYGIHTEDYGQSIEMQINKALVALQKTYIVTDIKYDNGMLILFYDDTAAIKTDNNRVNIATACQTWVALPQRHFNHGETVVCGNRCCQFVVQEATKEMYWRCPFCEERVRFIIRRMSDYRGTEAACFKCFAV